MIHGNLYYRNDIGNKYLSQYEKTGVSIQQGDNAVQNIKKYVENTYNENVLGKFGDFGGQIKLNEHQNILVSSIAAMLAAAISFMSRMYFWGGGRRDRNGHPAIILIAFISYTYYANAF